jgi:hypothetical protein
MARLDWDRERRRKSARRAKPQLQLRLERELAAATSRFFAESQPQNKRKQRAEAIESRYTTKLPFLATIKAGDRVYTAEVSRSGVRFVHWGEAHTNS